MHQKFGGYAICPLNSQNLNKLPKNASYLQLRAYSKTISLLLKHSLTDISIHKTNIAVFLRKNIKYKLFKNQSDSQIPELKFKRFFYSYNLINLELIITEENSSNKFLFIVTIKQQFSLF